MIPDAATALAAHRRMPAGRVVSLLTADDDELDEQPAVARHQVLPGLTGSRAQQVLDALRASPQPLTARDITEATGMDRKYCNQLVAALLASGEIEIVGKALVPGNWRTARVYRIKEQQR